MSIIGATILETAAGNASGKTVQLNVSVLKAQAKQLSAIKESYCALKNNISETLKTVDGAWSAQLQSTFSGIMDEQMKEMAYFERQLDIGISAANYVADNFSGKDEELAGNLDKSIADGVKELEREKSVTDNAARAIYMYENGLKYKGEDFPEGTASQFYKYSSDGSVHPHCTWYAASRYEAVNGSDNPLRFTQWSYRDAANWPNLIDRNYFNCDTANVDTIKTNTIAVSTTSKSHDNSYWDSRINAWTGASDNHVAYVEAVKDGYVYYSQGSSGWSMGMEGYIYKQPIDKFARDYNLIISAK